MNRIGKPAGPSAAGHSRGHFGGQAQPWCTATISGKPNVDNGSQKEARGTLTAHLAAKVARFLTATDTHCKRRLIVTAAPNVRSDQAQESGRNARLPGCQNLISDLQLLAFTNTYASAVPLLHRPNSRRERLLSLYSSRQRSLSTSL